LNAIQALYQLSYSPETSGRCVRAVARGGEGGVLG